jgi:hypothetical protein
LLASEVVVARRRTATIVMTSLGGIKGNFAGISVHIRLELSLRFGAERGPGMRKRPENKAFPRAATLGFVGFTPNMGYHSGGGIVPR